MNPTTSAFRGPIVSFAPDHRNIFVRYDSSPSVLVLRFVPAISVSELMPELFFGFIHLLAVAVQESSPYGHLNGPE